MKPTLAEYLLRERAEIFKRQETMEKLSGLFDELKGIFEVIDMEKSDQFKDEEEKSTQPTNETPKMTTSSRSRRPSQSSTVDRQSAPHSATLSRAYHPPPHDLSPSQATAGDVLSPRRELMDDLVDGISSQRFMSTTNTIPQHRHQRSKVTFETVPPNRAKTEAYRRELLAQIEEKKRIKQAEIDRQKAADEELEKKISEQRLKLYLDYLEERQKGDNFIVAKTAVDNTTQNAPEKLEVAAGTSKSSRTQPQHSTTFGDFSRHQLHKGQDPAAPQADRNILSNLGEVRKIMHHDHIEMLQQLLDMHIK